MKFRVWDKISESYSGGALWFLRSDGVVFYGNAEWPECVVQVYTGQQDIKGKEICEGDILRYSDAYGQPLTVVEWGFVVEHGLHTLYDTVDLYATEVIGNIYENPELMEDI